MFILFSIASLFGIFLFDFIFYAFIGLFVFFKVAIFVNIIKKLTNFHQLNHKVCFQTINSN